MGEKFLHVDFLLTKLNVAGKKYNIVHDLELSRGRQQWNVTN